MKPNRPQRLLPSIILFFTFLCAPLFAGTLLFEETFANYLDGSSLSGQKNNYGSWGYHWGTDPNSKWIVSNGAAVSTGSLSTTVRFTFTNSIKSSATSSLYFSFDITNVLADSVTSAMNELLYFQDSNGNNVFGIGIARNATTTQIRFNYNGGDYNNLVNSDALRIDTTNTIVGKLIFSDEGTSATLTVWINPENEASSVTRAVTLSMDVSDIGRLMLSRGTADTAVGTAFDNIRIGTDWNSVTAPIPEPRTIALTMGFVAVVALVGTRQLRK